jgi:phosphoserine phosphatase
MALVRPTRDDVAALGRAYIESLQPGAAETVSALQRAGVRVALVSGGLRQAVAVVGAHIGIGEDDVCGVAVRWDEAGNYIGFDEASPLTRDGGKPIVARALGLPTPMLAVGDGMTDAELKGLTGHFVAFTGTITRERAVAAADAVIARFPDLFDYVMQ